ncbi:MAG: GIY-YIG nuclease family protein [Chloroflexota bacterium]
MTSCFCYIVECADGTFYTGWTVDPEKRVKAHNAGRGAKYTRTRRPVRLVYVEPQPDRKTAMRREIQIKRLGHDGKRKLLAKAGK